MSGIDVICEKLREVTNELFELRAKLKEIKGDSVWVVVDGEIETKFRVFRNDEDLIEWIQQDLEVDINEDDGIISAIDDDGEVIYQSEEVSID